MKILITGKNSYIGNSVREWLNNKEPSYQIDLISLKNIDLNSISFKSYDVIFHVAGIAHISSSKKLIPEYFKVNRDLAIDVAKKAKEEGVKQFIFTSTMAIYGKDSKIGINVPIDVEKPQPTSAYGQSKLEADLTIQKLNSSNFKTAVLRIPMVYGKYAKGNFLKLYKLANYLSILPKINNKRSVIHINNLAEIVRIIIKNNMYGIFFPQDKEFFNTNYFICKIRNMKSKKTIITSFLNPLIVFISLFFKGTLKIYGNKFYDPSISELKGNSYQINELIDVIIELNKTIIS